MPRPKPPKKPPVKTFVNSGLYIRTPLPTKTLNEKELHEKMDAIWDKLEQLERKLETIFGNHIIINEKIKELKL